MESVVRSTGYKDNVSVILEYQKSKIVARSSDTWARLFRSCMFWFLVCITGLVVIFCPLYMFLKSNSKYGLVAFYRIIVPVDSINAQMTPLVLNTVAERKTITETVRLPPQARQHADFKDTVKS
jgi:hypothetical protein